MIENGRATENGNYSETDIIETTDEDGQVHVFEKVSELEVDGQEYALLIYKGNQPDEADEAEEGAEKDAVEGEESEEEEVVVMRITYEDGQEVYEAIEDEEEFEKVVAFIDNMDDEEAGVMIDLSEFTEEEKDEK
ncbi:DUF1292 domain-containing protein [Vampirovibrio sp.]|uniref:DUF1292 domain-containing protein n=1 Tax=Vampirovibrio sp. TaxID=2717857 RepID=UPI0035930199